MKEVYQNEEYEHTTSGLLNTASGDGMLCRLQTVEDLTMLSSKTYRKKHLR
jgi:hypothetical protein